MLSTVWVSGDGTTLFVSTFGDSYKVRRIRADPRVAVAACDGPGNLLPGEVYLMGTAAVLDRSEFYRQAFDLITSPAAKKAFDLSQEDDKLRDCYGRNRFGHFSARTDVCRL